ncbi:MAG TPA: DUF6155 family protein [Bacteroidia bacterium]|nr:DUF6155 family protein [Bacteroidia bacterium]
MSLKKYLQQFRKEQLIAQIIELNAKYKDVKTYYEFSINPNSDKAKEEAKKIINKCISTNINTNGGPKLKLQEARKAITGFKKLSPTENDIADVMLFYVECGVNYTNSFGDINEPFYNSIAGMFHDASKYIQTNGMQAQYKQRCKKIMDDKANIGWGFHDELSDYYYDFIEPPFK